MRHLLLIGVFLWPAQAALAGEGAAPDALSAAEEADGWVLLFDVQTPLRCRIEGEYKIENGTLVIGGAGTSRIRLEGNFYDDVAVQFDYQGRAHVVWHNVPFWGANGESYAYGLQATGPAHWHRAEHQVRYGTRTGSVVYHCQDLTADTALDDEGPNATGDAVFTRGYIDRFELEVPPGSTLILRHVMLKASQAAWLTWWAVALVLVLVLGAAAVVVRRRRKQQRARAAVVNSACRTDFQSVRLGRA